MVVPGTNRDIETLHSRQGYVWTGTGTWGTRTMQVHGDTTFRTGVWEYWEQEGGKGHRMGLNHHEGHGTMEICIDGTRNGCGSIGMETAGSVTWSVGHWGHGRSLQLPCAPRPSHRYQGGAGEGGACGSED